MRNNGGFTVHGQLTVTSGITTAWGIAFTIFIILLNTNPALLNDFHEQHNNGTATANPAGVNQHLQDMVNLGNVVFPIAGALGVFAGATVAWCISRSSQLTTAQIRNDIATGILASASAALIVNSGVASVRHDIVMLASSFPCAILLMVLALYLASRANQNATNDTTTVITATTPRSSHSSSGVFLQRPTHSINADFSDEEERPLVP